MPKDFIEKEFNSKINSIYNELYDLKKSCSKEVDSKLIALKRYTEGHASWARAGEISDLGIFGLRQYCKERNVDFNKLRIDEYYGVTDTKVIENEWKKLNPPKHLLPIDYRGHSLYSRSGKVEDVTRTEKYFNEAISDAYINECRYIASKFICTWFDACNVLVCNINSEGLKEEFDFYIENKIGKFFYHMSKGLIIYNSQEVDYFKVIIDRSYNYLNDALKSGSVKNLLNSFDTLEKYLIYGYYDMSLKTEMFDNLDDIIEFKKGKGEELLTYDLEVL